MSIRSFINTAEELYNNGKYGESLCLACIAIDATASKIYTMSGNGNRYQRFLKDHFYTICEYGFPGILASNIRIKVTIPNNSLKPDSNGYVDMEQILYKVLRCGLVHECNIEDTVEFTDNVCIGDWDQKFNIPKAIIEGLIVVVRESLEKYGIESG